MPNICCQKQINYGQWKKLSKIFTLYYHVYQTLYNSIAFFFLVNNRTVPKDQIKTLISQSELKRTCQNNGFHYFLWSSSSLLCHSLSKKLHLRVDRKHTFDFLAGIYPPCPFLLNSGKLSISEMKTKIGLLNCLLRLD